MENLPSPDFIVSFYHGVRFYQSSAKNIIEFKIPNRISEDYRFRENVTRSGDFLVYQKQLSANMSQTVDTAVRNLYIHALECLKRCTQVRDDAKLDPETIYPIIIKSNQSPSTLSTPHSPTNSMYGSVNTFSSTVKDFKSPSSIGNESKASITRSRSKALLLQRDNGLRDSFRDSKASLGNASTISISHKFTPKHIPKVGWCVQTPDRRFCILFEDGTHLIVNPKGLTLDYSCDELKRYFLFNQLQNR